MLAYASNADAACAGLAMSADRLSVVVECVEAGDRPAACVAFGDFRATLRERLHEAELGGVLRDALQAFSQCLSAADVAGCSGLACHLRDQLRSHFPSQADALLRFN